MIIRVYFVIFLKQYCNIMKELAPYFLHDILRRRITSKLRGRLQSFTAFRP